MCASAQIVKNQEWEFAKKVTFDDSVRITDGAGAGKILTSDARGIATWQTSSAGTILSASITLDSADLVSLHSVPDTIVAAQGANTVIMPIRFITYMDYTGDEYATEGTLIVQLGGVTQTTYSGILGLTSDVLLAGSPSNTSQQAPIPQINSALTVTTPTSNPTAGNSTVKITVLYSVITLN